MLEPAHSIADEFESVSTNYFVDDLGSLLFRPTISTQMFRVKKNKNQEGVITTPESLLRETTTGSLVALGTNPLLRVVLMLAKPANANYIDELCTVEANILDKAWKYLNGFENISIDKQVQLLGLLEKLAVIDGRVDLDLLLLLTSNAQIIQDYSEILNIYFISQKEDISNVSERSIMPQFLDVLRNKNFEIIFNFFQRKQEIIESISNILTGAAEMGGSPKSQKNISKKLSRIVNSYAKIKDDFRGKILKAALSEKINQNRFYRGDLEGYVGSFNKTFSVGALKEIKNFNKLGDILQPKIFGTTTQSSEHYNSTIGAIESLLGEKVQTLELETYKSKNVKTKGWRGFFDKIQASRGVYYFEEDIVGGLGLGNRFEKVLKT